MESITFQSAILVSAVSDLLMAPVAGGTLPSSGRKGCFLVRFATTAPGVAYSEPFY